MKSKAKIPLEFGQKPIEYLKNSSFNFLENERTHIVVERGHVDQEADNCADAKEANNAKIEQSPQEHSPVSTTEESTVPSTYGPKKYTTTCFFQPKQKPVYYSETMIVNIGSKNKKYFESIYYENKLIPFRWTEKMTTIIPDKEPVLLINSDINIPIEKPAFHYISLQQPEEQLQGPVPQKPEQQSYAGFPAA